MNYGIWIGCNSNKGKVQAGFEDANGRDYFVTSPNTYNDGNWHYVVVTYDGSVLRLYVDGQQVASLNTNNAIPDYNWDKPLVIGKNSLDDSRYFIGDIDEVRVYNRALSAQEVSDAYNNGIFSNDGLVEDISSPTLLTNDMYYFDLLNEIRQAKSKIYLYVYQIEFTSSDTSRPRMLLNELVNAKNRGVDVRVMFNDDSINVKALRDFLTSNNIPYKERDLHSKIVVIDDKWVYVGSSNWRVSSLQYNNELNIKSNNVKVIKSANDYLNAIWNNMPTLNLVSSSIYTAEELLSGGYYDSVKRSIDNSIYSIRLIMKYIDPYSTDPNHKPSNLLRSLVDAKNRGVDVRVIIDDTVPSSVRDFLKNNKIPTKLDPSSTQSTHVKSILIDDTVYVGSHNWQSVNLSVGDTTIKVNNNIAISNIKDDFMSYFDYLWNRSSRSIYP
jgi:phosphatidylserine/phosphatidylglycerophosphate/cardiolipin synthase-like enzyme